MINIPIPSLHKIEEMIRRGPSIKDGLNSLIQEDPLQSDSDEILKLKKKIEEQDEAIYAKKNEIEMLKSKVADLEKIYKSQKRHTWELEETIDNYKHQTKKD